MKQETEEPLAAERVPEEASAYVGTIDEDMEAAEIPDRQNEESIENLEEIFELPDREMIKLKNLLMLKRFEEPSGDPEDIDAEASDHP